MPYVCAAPLPLNGVDPAALAAQVSRKVGIQHSVRHLPRPSSLASVCASQEVCASCLWPGLLPTLARARACEDCAARAAQACCAARRVSVGQINSARLLAKSPPFPAAHTSDGSSGGSSVGSGCGQAASTALAAAAAPAAVAAAGGVDAAGMLGAARPPPIMPHDNAFSLFTARNWPSDISAVAAVGRWQ